MSAVLYDYDRAIAGLTEVANDWMPATGLRAIVENDPCQLWLQFHGKHHGLEPDSADYSFLSFIGNNASVTTPNANISNTSAGSVDYDYYKINLASGFSYTISARLNDSRNSGNGQVYTEDAIFSYSADGNTFSNTFDDLMPNSILSPNGGTISFLVSPKFTGTSGTYLLEISVLRNPLGIEEPPFEAIRIYPNPVKDVLRLDLASFKGNTGEIQVLNAEGKELLKLSQVSPGQAYSLPVDQLPEGLYVLRMKTGSGWYSEKFVISR